MRRPDFIIIGAMKCATSTLHVQLAQQPGIFMSDPKEPNFFSDDDEWSRGADWYASLFAPAPADTLCGESSTHYTKLPTYPRTIDRMRSVLTPGTKFIYLMRDPVDRVISHYVHEWSQRVVTGPIDQALDQHPELIAYSRYAMQLEPYIEAFGRERILPMFFERLLAEPQRELERACRFIGYGGSPCWNDSLAEQNVSSRRLRKSWWRDAIVDVPLMRLLRRTFVPKSIRTRVARWWTMDERPALSPPRRDQLCNIFDEDLRSLGQWFNLDLQCATFRSIASEASPEWSGKERVRIL